MNMAQARDKRDGRHRVMPEDGAVLLNISEQRLDLMQWP